MTFGNLSLSLDHKIVTGRHFMNEVFGLFSHQSSDRRLGVDNTDWNENVHKSANLGFGQIAVGNSNNTVAVTVQSITTATITHTVTVSPAFANPNGPTVTESSTTLVVGSGGTAKFSVTSTVSATTATGDY